MTTLQALINQKYEKVIPQGVSIFTVYYNGYEVSFSIKDVTEESFNMQLEKAITSLKDKFKTFNYDPVVIAMIAGSNMYSIENIKLA